MTYIVLRGFKLVVVGIFLAKSETKPSLTLKFESPETTLFRNFENATVVCIEGI